MFSLEKPVVRAELTALVVSVARSPGVVVYVASSYTVKDVGAVVELQLTQKYSVMAAPLSSRFVVVRLKVRLKAEESGWAAVLIVDSAGSAVSNR